MKLLVGLIILGLSLLALAQPVPKKSIPKYDLAAEAVYKGTVEDVRDRPCPVSGGMGAHIIMKLDNGMLIEVHLATVAFTKMIDMNLRKGDEVEVTGWKTELEGVQTIFARQVKDGHDTYVFRMNDGTPAWIGF
jgi:TusA-related sulfurtransferase